MAVDWDFKALVFSNERCAFAFVVEAFSEGCDHFEEPVRF
jgi:hypothetical protein